MIAMPSPRLARLVAVALLVVALVAIGSLVLRMYTAFQENRASIRDLSHRLGVLRSLAAQERAVNEWAAELARVSDRGAFLTGESESLIAAMLQSRVAEVAEASGVALTSFRTLDPKPAEGLVDLALEVTLSGDLAGLRGWLDGIESATPLLFVSRAEVRSDGRGDSGDGEQPMLEAKLEVHGYMRAKAAPVLEP